MRVKIFGTPQLAKRFRAKYKEARQVFCAIAACNSYESSIQLLPLQHSVFTYFLLEALQCSPNAQGELHLKQVYDHIHTACMAPSSLFIHYNPKEKSLAGIKMSPRVFNDNRTLWLSAGPSAVCSKSCMKSVMYTNGGS